MGKAGNYSLAEERGMKRPAKPKFKLPRLLPMRVLRIKPGDVLVLQTDLMLRPEQCEQLRQLAEQQFGNANRIAVVTAGIKIGVLRPDEPQSGPPLVLRGPSNTGEIGRKRSTP